MSNKVPLRRCVVCREMKEKRELLRVVLKDDSFFIDPTGKAAGRGAYICKDGDCMEKAEKTRGFDRSFKRRFDAQLIDEIKTYKDDKND